jgi:hypothetical protein
VILVIATTGVSARAQLIVEDVASIAQDAVDQIVDLAKYVEMVNNQVQQINTMTQELQQVTAYVQAYGDPSQLLNIIGANELIDSLQQSGIGQTLGAPSRQLQEWKLSEQRRGLVSKHRRNSARRHPASPQRRSLQEIQRTGERRKLH